MPSADVEAAFDGIGHEDVTQALLQKGVHPGTVCQFLRESFDLRTESAYRVQLVSSEFLDARVTRQGSVEGPDLWNQVLDNVLREPMHVGKLRESALDLQRITAERRRKDVAPSSDAVDNGGRCFIIYAGLTICPRCQEQWTA